jgi:GTP:adenosylcobinamide-phosphate guanylyltransferase
MEYIIVQAGGKGSRMGKLTSNKPKALISINGTPLLLHLLRLHEKTKFIVIADYKYEVMESYLNCFAPARTELVKAHGKGTCAGINMAMERIPAATSFSIVWSDLYFESPIELTSVNQHAANWIGLSNTFSCRWQFDDHSLHEAESDRKGVAGVFVFKSKEQLAGLPDEGEFCRFLQKSGVRFKPFYLQDMREIGTLAGYEEFIKFLPRTRPFNEIKYLDSSVEKMPRDKMGAELAVFERNWYRATSSFRWDFVPEVFSFEPVFVMERIDGLPLHETNISLAEKEAVLTLIVSRLKEIHQAFPSFPVQGWKNDYEAILGKSRRRLDSIRSLLPNVEVDYYYINGRKCINFYKHWTILEELACRYYPKNYRFIHGDPTFSNILYDIRKARLCFIDPRGYYGREKLFGDVDYDWAKLYYSISGNYDQFNCGNFDLDMKSGEITLNIRSNGWEDLLSAFFAQVECDRMKIDFLHAIIWLSLTSYTWNDYDAVCAAFFNGIYHMQCLYEKG